MSLFALVGGYLGMITRLSNWSLRNYRGFTVDKSMIKKLFSRKKRERNNFTYFGEKDPDDSYSDSEKSEGLNEKQRKIIDFTTTPPHLLSHSQPSHRASVECP